MTNPFDDDSVAHVVLRNAEGQHSLWPSFAPVPAGWSRVFGPADRSACLAHVEAVWTDLRPLSLQRALARADERRRPARGGRP